MCVCVEVNNEIKSDSMKKIEKQCDLKVMKFLGGRVNAKTFWF